MPIMNIFLYQIWYDEHSKPDENSGFLAFDCRQNPEFLKREIAHLMRFYDEIIQHANDNDYFALLSPRFFEKTGLTADDVKKFALHNPNQDIYLFNPYPMNVYLYTNVWEQGEEQHCNLKQLTQNLLNKTNSSFDIFSNHRNTINNTVYCNYWLASKKFFDDFIVFIKKMDNAIDAMPDNEKAQYFQETTYFRITAIFYPFIFERLLSLYLLLNPSKKSKPYIYEPTSIIFKNGKKLHRKFYFNGYREKYDQYECNEKDSKVLIEKLTLLKNFIDPNYKPFPFKTLNKWTNSIIKRLNLYKFNQFFDTII